MLAWGSGPALGLLTCLGYILFSLGCLFLWRPRTELSFWMENEVCLLRRNLSRHTPAGPFYEPRCESRLLVIPSSFFNSISQLPQRRFSWGGFLLVFGLLLFALAFFV